MTLRERILAGRFLTLCVFLVAGAAITLFLFATVHNRSGSELLEHSGARRSYNTITYWNDHGYFASGGVINLVAPPGSPAPRMFYRTSTGAYMISGYLLEKTAFLTTGTYRWRLLAIHNSILMMLTAALIALFAYRLLARIGLERRYALVFAVGTLAVYITFPDVLAQYWELSAHAAAIPFAILFLLLDDLQSSGQKRQILEAIRIAAAFGVTYFEFIFGTFFLLSYCAVVLLRDASRERVRELVFKALLPAAAALILFQGQLALVRITHPDVPFTGSEFMFRTGFDGSTVYYHGHEDILYGRNVARRNFPANRAFLFRWPSLFIAGALAAGFVVSAGAVNDPLRPLLTILPLMGAYVIYAALFSQAVVIHPYYYDILIATPLMIALFAFAPALLEMRFQTRGVVTLITMLAALSYSMVQIRDYAMWYPLPQVKSSEHRPQTK